MSHSNWMLYGANGYTGELIAREAVARGMRPLLAGRNRRTIEALALELGCASRVFDLDDPDRTAESLLGVAAVLHCAGPFSATGEPMMDACLHSHVDYLDVTGEVDVIEAAAARHDRAVQAGVRLIPAVGFDVVPSDCLAALLAQRLPDASSLTLGLFTEMSFSPGTTKTMFEQLPLGARVRIGGKITRVPLAWKTREIPFRSGVRESAIAPWGDVASAWYTTGIPNIEVYMSMQPAQIRLLRKGRWLLRLLGTWPLRAGLRRLVTKHVRGPSADERHNQRASFWGQVSNEQGNQVEATLETPNGYHLTIIAALECVRRLLDGGIAPGFFTPAKAFGANLILELPETDLQFR